jgi:hypothetical protein
MVDDGASEIKGSVAGFHGGIGKKATFWLRSGVPREWIWAWTFVLGAQRR